MLRLRASTGKPELLPVRYLKLEESLPIAFPGGFELRPDGGVKVVFSTTLVIRAEPRCLVRPEVPTKYSIVAPEQGRPSSSDGRKESTAKESTSTSSYNNA